MGANIATNAGAPVADASVATDDGFGAGRCSLSPTSSVVDLRSNRDAAVDKFSVSISSFLLKINVKNFHGSLTTVVRAHNDNSKIANITYTIFDRTYWYSPYKRRRFENR